MWRDGQLISLLEILNAIEANDWAWEVREFSGVGTAPAGASMAEFEAAVRKSAVQVSWAELCQLAGSIEQVWDCLVIGFDASAGSTLSATTNGELTGTRLVVEAHDSTVWELSSPDAFLLERVATRLGVLRLPSPPRADT